MSVYRVSSWMVHVDAYSDHLRKACWWKVCWEMNTDKQERYAKQWYAIKFLHVPCTSLNVWMCDLPCTWRNFIAYHCSVYCSCSSLFISQHTFHQQALRKRWLYASTVTVHDETWYTDVEWVYLKPYTSLFVRQCCHFVYARLSQSFLISLHIIQSCATFMYFIVFHQFTT